MANEQAMSTDFKDKISWHLEALLQLSLSLTTNGRDATKLMRETLAEAAQLLDESPSEQHWGTRLQSVLTCRFLISRHGRSEPLPGSRTDNIDESLIGNNILFPVASHPDRRRTWQTEGSDADGHYLRAIASLPVVCRTAMILSHLEGFSTLEIADLAGVRPNAVESLLGQGRRFIREELFRHLMGDDSEDISDEQAAESA